MRKQQLRPSHTAAITKAHAHLTNRMRYLWVVIVIVFVITAVWLGLEIVIECTPCALACLFIPWLTISLSPPYLPTFILCFLQGILPKHGLVGAFVFILIRDTGWVKKKLTGIGDVFQKKQMTLKSSVKHILNKHFFLPMRKRSMKEIDHSLEELCLFWSRNSFCKLSMEYLTKQMNDFFYYPLLLTQMIRFSQALKKVKKFS